MNNEIKKAFEQLIAESQCMKYGELALRVYVHNGEVRGVELTTTRKTRPE